MNRRHEGPLPCGAADPCAPEIERNPEHDNRGGDASHGAIGVLIPGRVDPGIGVEAEEEAEHGLEAHDRQGDFAGYGTIGIDYVYEADVGALDNGEVH